MAGVVRYSSQPFFQLASAGLKLDTAECICQEMGCILDSEAGGRGPTCRGGPDKFFSRAFVSRRLWAGSEAFARGRCSCPRSAVSRPSPQPYDRAERRTTFGTPRAELLLMQETPRHVTQQQVVCYMTRGLKHRHLPPIPAHWALVLPGSSLVRLQCADNVNPDAAGLFLRLA